MDYDPVKDRLGSFFWATPARTRAFYRVLDAVFLRSWYVRRALRQRVEALGPGPVRVLDAGTGFGQYAYWLVRRFPNVEVVAVDVKDDYLDRARAFVARTPYAGRVTFEQADLTRPLPYDATFDLALSVDVMEHIEDDRAVFRHVRAALKPGGHLLVNTPSDQGGSGVEDGGEGFIGEHVRDGYPVAELHEKLATAGLDPVETVWTYGPVGSAAWRLLVKWPMVMLNRSRWLAPVVGAYYVGAGPVGLALNALDLRRPNRTGTGLLVTAQRPV